MRESAEGDWARLFAACASYAAAFLTTTPAIGRPRNDASDESTPQETAHWREGDPVPSGYHVERKEHLGAFVTGFALFSISYSIAAGIALSSGRGWLFVPLVGPFAGLKGSPGDAGLVMDSLAQSIGAILLGYGLTSSAALVSDGYSVFVPTPMWMGSTGAGLGLTGRF